MTNAIVVGGGPNGLAAALTLASEGVDVTIMEANDQVGGGARSSEAIVPGLLHDHCAAFHPMGPTSDFVRRFELEKYGLRWLAADIDMAHPLDDGSAGLLYRSVEQTAGELGDDGARWRQLFAHNAAHFGELADDIMKPLIRVPSHPLGMARFGLPTGLPATVLGRAFSTEQGRAVFGGIAAHAFQPLSRPLSSAIGLGIATAGHHNGWVVAKGGTQALTDAVMRRLAEFGVRVETGVRVKSLADLPPSDITMFDLTPEAIADIAGDRLPVRISAQLRKFRHGPGAFKVDFAVEGGVPWTNAEVGRAGTVHLGGGFAEIVNSERDVARGLMPERPFVLVGQQYVADPSRSVEGVHPVYSYAHVPNGYTGDATDAIIRQFERFAPGFRQRIVGMQVRSTTEMAAQNTNFVGGDIITGAKNIPQLVFGPLKTSSPYSLGAGGMYQCSAATPPGPGAHGMCGFNAAQKALADVRQ